MADEGVPSQNVELLEQLVRTMQGMETTRTLESQRGWSTMYRSGGEAFNTVSPRGPEPFNDPMMNMGYQFLVPLIAKLSGVDFKGFMPQMGNGIDSFTAQYSNAYTTPAYQAYAGGFNATLGAQMFDAAGGALTKLNVHSLMNMGESEFRQWVSNVGSTPGGAMAANAAINMVPQLQSIMGGNPLAASQAIWANAGLIATPPGTTVDYMRKDGTINTDLPAANAQAASVFQKAFFENFYAKRNERGEVMTDDKTGEIITQLFPDNTKLRGFKVEDVARFATGYMAQAGFTVDDEQGGRVAFGAATTGQQVKGVEENLRVLQAVKEIFTSASMPELVSTLNQLSQGSWGHVDPETVTRKINDLKGMAMALNQGTEDFGRLVVNTQQQLATIEGVAAAGSPTAMRSASGQLLNGTANQAVSTYMATLGVAAAQANGSWTPNDIQDSMARQMGALKMGIESPLGKDVTMIEWLNERKALNAGEYERYTELLKTGSITEQRAEAERILSARGLSRDMMNDPVFATMISSQVGQIEDQAAVRRNMNILNAQSQELPQRIQERRISTLRYQTDQVANAAELTSAETRQRMAAENAAMVAQLEASGAGGLASLVAEQFAAEGGGGAGATAVRSLIGTEPFEQYRNKLNQAAAVAGADFVSGLAGTEGRAGAVSALRTRMGLMERVATPAQQAELAEISTTLDTDWRAAQVQFNRMAGTMTEGQRAFVLGAIGPNTAERSLATLQGQITAVENPASNTWYDRLAEIQGQVAVGAADMLTTVKQRFGAQGYMATAESQAHLLGVALGQAQDYAGYKSDPMGQRMAMWATGTGGVTAWEALGLDVARAENAIKITDPQMAAIKSMSFADFMQQTPAQRAELYGSDAAGIMNSSQGVLNNAPAVLAGLTAEAGISILPTGQVGPVSMPVVGAGALPTVPAPVSNVNSNAPYIPAAASRGAVTTDKPESAAGTKTKMKIEVVGTLTVTGTGKDNAKVSATGAEVVDGGGTKRQ